MDFSNSDGEEVLINSVLSRRISANTAVLGNAAGVIELMMGWNTTVEPLGDKRVKEQSYWQTKGKTYSG